jgi:hypothetical protein
MPYGERAGPRLAAFFMNGRWDCQAREISAGTLCITR